MGKDKGELYKRILDEKDSWCFCGGETDDETDPSYRPPKSCKTKREPTKEEINQALDEARKDFYSILMAHQIYDKMGKIDVGTLMHFRVVMGDLIVKLFGEEQKTEKVACRDCGLEGEIDLDSITEHDFYIQWDESSKEYYLCASCREKDLMGKRVIYPEDDIHAF